MNKVITTLLLLFSLAIALQAEVKYSINEAWRFSLGDTKNGYQQSLDDKSWEMVSFPHTWNDKDALDEVPGFLRGQGWYRKSLYISDVAEGKSVYLLFEGVNQVTDLYINEKFVGSHKGGYARFCFDITQYINLGEGNLVAIGVDNSFDKMIPPLSADFTFFGGIYRDVYIKVVDNLHLSPLDRASSGSYIATPNVSEQSADVEIRTLINNNNSGKKEVVVEYTILSPNGEVVGSRNQRLTLGANVTNVENRAVFKLANPKLWSTKSPNLYTLHTVIKERAKGEILDSSLENFGLRWFSFDAEKGFFLNGKHLKLIGTNRHQCFENMGNALDDQLHIRDVQLLKEMGGNFLRISHYPQDPLVMEMCDKLGIITSVEIPIVNTISEEQEFLDNSIVMLDEMVKQHYNNPSLVLWTYMNEVMLRLPYDEKTEEYKRYCKEVNRHATAIEKRIRELDPHRYTQIPFHGAINRYEDAGLTEIPMTVGLNIYNGWYSEGVEKLEPALLSFRANFPNTPITISEYGADVDQRIHSEKPERFDFSVEFGDLFHEHYLKVFLENDYVSGMNIWNLNDFHSEIRTDAVPHVNSKGITTLDRTPKNSFYLYKAHLTEEPFVKIGSGDWIYRSGVANGDGIYSQTVKIYSNQTAIDFLHNGKLLSQVDVVDGRGEVVVPFSNGLNRLEARLTEYNISDVSEVRFNLIAQTLDKSFEELNVLLGSNRSFEDKVYKTAWIPEKEYSKGSWGYVGGEKFMSKTRFGSLPAVDLDVLGSDKDPIFQTQRVNIDSFKADVPDGRYAVYLYWADFSREEDQEIVAYTLGNDREYDNIQPRIFDVSINSQRVLGSYDIPNEVGVGRAIIKKFELSVTGKEGITIDFTPIEGETILNAVRILKID